MELTNPNRRGIINHREDRKRREGPGILSVRRPVSNSLIFGRNSDRGFRGFHGSETGFCLFAPSVVAILCLRLAALRGLRRILRFVLAALATLSASAQIQQAWVARYNNGIINGTNQVVKMALDSAGNIYVTGLSQNANSNLGYVTIKYAPNGNQLWASRYDSTNYPAATPTGLVLDNSDNVVVTGSALTVKYDANGNQLWTAPYSGTALAVDGCANIYVTGFGTNFNTVKLTPAGSNVWCTRYVDIGPTLSQVILVDGNTNVYVAGADTYSSYGQGGVIEGYNVQLAIVRYDSNGNQLWTATSGGPPTSVQVEGAALDSANNLYLVWNWPGQAGYLSYKYSTNGDLSWVLYPTVVGSVGFYGSAYGLTLDNTGDVLLTGQVNYPLPGGNIYYGPEIVAYGTYKATTNGSLLWSSYFPMVQAQPSAGLAIAVDLANNSYVTGYSPGTNSGNDIVTIKYGPNGNQVWLQRYHGPGNGNDAGNAIAVDNKDNVYVTGYETTAAGGTEMVTIKYSPVTLQRRSDGTVWLQAQGTNGESFDFQGSTDLMNWLDLGSVLADSNGVAQFQDTNASNYNWRFYITSPQ
jgi:hypothetical protein